MRSEGFPVESVCRVLTSEGCRIAARTYRWLTQPGRPPSARSQSDAQVLDLIEALAWTTDHQGRRILAPEGLYGRRKMTALVRRRGLPQASPGSVDRAMRTLGLSGVTRTKRVRTTIPAKDGRRAGDLLNRDFTAPAPDRRWVMDFTYVRTWAGFVYVAFIVDCYSQKILAWHADTTKKTSLVLTPLRMALWQRDRDDHPVRAGQLTAHSDAGSQYTSVAYTEHLDLERISPSIGSVGDAYDNALMESVNGLYKAECIRTTVFHSGPYRSIADVEYATMGWVAWWNTQRLHSTLDYLTPDEYETAYYQTTGPTPEPVTQRQ